MPGSNSCQVYLRLFLSKSRVYIVKYKLKRKEPNVTMSQPYAYQRHYEIIDPKDEYTHLVISAEFYKGSYNTSHKLIGVTHKDTYFKCSNVSEATNLVRGLDPECFQTRDPSGFVFHIYAIKKSAPEYAHAIVDPQRTNNYWNPYMYLPLGSVDAKDKFDLVYTISRFDTRIFIAESQRFTVKLMRQIESQFSTLINQLLPIDTDRNVTMLAGFKINLDAYEEFIDVNCY